MKITYTYTIILITHLQILLQQTLSLSSTSVSYKKDVFLYQNFINSIYFYSFDNKTITDSSQKCLPECYINCKSQFENEKEMKYCILKLCECDSIPNDLSIIQKKRSMEAVMSLSKSQGEGNSKLLYIGNEYNDYLEYSNNYKNKKNVILLKSFLVKFIIVAIFILMTNIIIKSYIFNKNQVFSNNYNNITVSINNKNRIKHQRNSHKHVKYLDYDELDNDILNRLI